MLKIVLILLLLVVFKNDGRLTRNQRQKYYSAQSSRKFRISPTTGVRIALPSKLLSFVLPML